MQRLDEKTISVIESILKNGNYAEVKAYRHGFKVTEIRKSIKMMPPVLDDGGRDKMSVK